VPVCYSGGKPKMSRLSLLQRTRPKSEAITETENKMKRKWNKQKQKAKKNLKKQKCNV